MTVSTLTNRVTYVGNGSTTQFAVSFRVLDEDHLVVKRRLLSSNEIDHTYIGTDYSYSGIGDDAGTLTLDGTALSSLYQLEIERIVPYTQELDIVNAGGFYPETVEEQLDITTMQIQQVAAQADDIETRALMVPVGDEAPDYVDFETYFRGPQGPPGTTDGVLNLLDFQENTVPGTTDFKAAFDEALASISLLNAHFTQPAIGEIVIPNGWYYFSDTVYIDKPVIIRGMDVGGPVQSGHATVLTVAANKTLFQVRHSLAEGGPGTEGSGSQFHNLFLLGSGTSETTAGIFAGGRVAIHDVGTAGFANGIHIYGELNPAGTIISEASSSRIVGGTHTSNRNAGVKVEGGDANICLLQNLDCIGNGNWGIENISFLGILIEACHTRTNAVPGTAGRTVPAICSYGGKNWTVAWSQETAASTETPGTGSAWLQFTPGGDGVPGFSIPWTSGLTWKAGGPYACISTAGNGNMLLACYSEADQPPSQVIPPCITFGGTHGAGITVVSPRIYTAEGTFNFTTGVQVLGAVTAGPAVGEIAVALARSPGSGIVQEFFHVLAGDGFAFTFGGPQADLAFGISNGPIAFAVSSDNTIQTFGRSTAQPGKAMFPELALGDYGNGRIMTMASAAPTNGYHARGEVVYNVAPTAGGKVGWSCTSSGEPGTWKPFGAIDA